MIVSRTFISTRILLVIAVIWLAPAFASQEPAWWEAVYDPSQSPNNFAVVNVGQLKHVATMARIHLEEFLTLNQSDWDSAYEGTSPLPFLENPDAENWSVANVGQVKFVAAGFYRLLAIHAPAYNLTSRFSAMGLTDSEHSQSGGVPYPWKANVPHPENYSPALIGQLKIAFSFDLAAALASNPDLDGDGIPNGYEQQHGLNSFTAADALLDRDGDGMKNLEEYLYGYSASDSSDLAPLPSDSQLVLRVTDGFLSVNITTWRLSFLSVP